MIVYRRDVTSMDLLIIYIYIIVLVSPSASTLTYAVATYFVVFNFNCNIGDLIEVWYRYCRCIGMIKAIWRWVVWFENDIVLDIACVFVDIPSALWMMAPGRKHIIWINICCSYNMYILFNRIASISKLHVILHFIRKCVIVNLISPDRNGRHFADNIFRCIFMNKKND